MKIKNYRNGDSLFLGILIVVMFAFLPTAARAFAQTEEGDRVEDAIRVLHELMELPEEGIPESLLQKAYGIAIIPGVIKGAYGIGGQYGKGVLLVKEEEGWTNPTFIILAGGSIGWQIGIQKSDVVLVFKSRQSVRNIAQGKITLGADAGVTAGPVGRSAEASTDLDMKAEIYSYSKSKGLFAGVSVKGGVIQIDQEANGNFYQDPDVSAQEILSNVKLQAPPSAEKLKEALRRYTQQEFHI